ncbi:MAG TPA: dockerin type I repeat-containing protein [Armatimonadota bacterium]|jgi:hypothetical protein
MRSTSWLLGFALSVSLASTLHAQDVTNHYVAKGDAAALTVDADTKQAQRFTSAVEFSKLEVNVAEATAGSALKLTLYRWRGNYADSTGAPKQLVKSDTLSVSAPGWVTLNLPVQPAGMYLWEAAAVADKSGVGLAAYNGSTYLGGESFTKGAANDKTIERRDGGGVAEDLSQGDSAQHFTSESSFNELQVFSPTWNDETGAKGYTLKLFPWKVDYDTTLAGTPVASGFITNFKDNAWVSLYFTTQPAGEYLWLATDPVKPPIGHWRSNNDLYPGEAYRKGQDLGGADFPIALGHPASGGDGHTDLQSRTTRAAPVPKVVLTSPAEDEVVATNPPTLKWEAVPDATAYSVEMSLAFSFDPDVTQVFPATTNSLTPPAALPIGRWYWRVKATVPAGETDFTSSVYRQTLVPPAAGGEVVLDDFERVDAWVMRALTFSLSTDEKHAGKASMKLDLPLNYGYAAADAPLGRLVPKTSDGQNPTALYLWVNVSEMPDPPFELKLNVTTSDGKMGETPFGLLPVTIEGADVGKWVKKVIPLDTEFSGLPLSDPSRTLAVFEVSRGTPDAAPVNAVTAYLDDLGAVYPASTAPPPVLKGDVTGDNKLGIADVVLALRVVAGLVTPTAQQLAAGDLNGNGKVEISEVIKILRAVAGLGSL